MTSLLALTNLEIGTFIRLTIVLLLWAAFFIPICSLLIPFGFLWDFTGAMFNVLDKHWGKISIVLLLLYIIGIVLCIPPH